MIEFWHEGNCIGEKATKGNKCNLIAYTQCRHLAFWIGPPPILSRSRGGGGEGSNINLSPIGLRLIHPNGFLRNASWHLMPILELNCLKNVILCYNIVDYISTLGKIIGVQFKEQYIKPWLRSSPLFWIVQLQLFLAIKKSYIELHTLRANYLPLGNEPSSCWCKGGLVEICPTRVCGWFVQLASFLAF